MLPRVIIKGDKDAIYGEQISTALEGALQYEGKISDELLNLEGMSGKKYRYLINNLIGSIQDPRYLEVGSWAGSTLCSAIFDNECTATAIDNWSEFGGPSAKFFSNLGQFASAKNKISFINSDFRAARFDALGKFNVYLFDGPHATQDQYDGVVLALPALDKQFVFIVDDWNWDYVRTGTLSALSKVGADIKFSVEIFSTEGDVHPGTIGLPTDERSDWHNGYFIASVQIP